MVARITGNVAIKSKMKFSRAGNQNGWQYRRAEPSSLRAVKTNKNICEKDDRESFGRISLSHKQLHQRIRAERVILPCSRCKPRQRHGGSQIRQHILDCMGAFRISFFFQFCGFDGQLLLELILAWNRVSLEQCIKFDFCLVNPQFFDSLFFKLGFGVTQKGRSGAK